MKRCKVGKDISEEIKRKSEDDVKEKANLFCVHFVLGYDLLWQFNTLIFQKERIRATP